MTVIEEKIGDSAVLVDNHAFMGNINCLLIPPNHRIVRQEQEFGVAILHFDLIICARMVSYVTGNSFLESHIWISCLRREPTDLVCTSAHSCSQITNEKSLRCENSSQLHENTDRSAVVFRSICKVRNG